MSTVNHLRNYEDWRDETYVFVLLAPNFIADVLNVSRVRYCLCIQVWMQKEYLIEISDCGS